MSVKTKSIQYYNYITGSTGWPTNTNVGVVSGLDYIVESGSNDVYFLEQNTNVFFAGSQISLGRDVYDKISNYVASQSCDTCYVYGHPGNEDFGVNPPLAHQPLISSSFARHNIPVNFQYQDNTSVSYFSQRGQDQYSGSFHLWIQTPWYSDDALRDMTSGSGNKITFRGLLENSPVSSSLIPLFNTSSYTDNIEFPDFVAKKPNTDASLFINGLNFYSYHPNSSSYQNEVNSGSLIEKYIIQSGSYQDGFSFLDVGKITHMLTPTEQVYLGNSDQEIGHKTSIQKWNLVEKGDQWKIKPIMGKTASSGSLIEMYDGTQKQIQDIEVGDVVKSYQPLGMPDETMDYVSYTTTDLSGSYDSGSIVVQAYQDTPLTFYGYYLLNGSIKIPLQSKASDAYYFVKQGGTWGWRNPYQIAVGDYFLDKDGNELEITSKTEVQDNMTWYSLDVEDIDTYFSSNILVHNLPPKCCFVKGTKITMRDNSQKNIEDVEIGDLVLTYDIDKKELIKNVVLATSSPINNNFVRITFEDGTTNENVPDHPYWVVGKGWSSHRPDWTKETHDIDCEQLNIGDICLKSIEGKKVIEQKVIKIEKYEKEQETYNLTIENTENYFANDILVHNKFPFCCCFLPEQSINMADGTYKEIGSIKETDLILSYDEENDEFTEATADKITIINHTDCYEMKVESGQTLKPTGNHPFLIKDKGWSTIDKHNPNHAGGNGRVEVGDYVRDIDGWVEITEINKINGEFPTYSFKNKKHETIVAHDIVSHNSEPEFCGRCFIGHTMITLPDGTYQRIENLKPGDEIKTYNVETGKLENEIIEMITTVRHDNLVTYKFDDNTKITATLDHPFFISGDSYVDSDYRPLKIGDKVKNDELNVLEVVEIELNQGVEVTYNIEKTRNGNYFANKVLVSDESEIPFT